MQEENRYKLVKASVEGDEEAFGKLIRSYEKYIAHIAFTTLKNEQDAEDAIQDAVLAMYRNIGSLKNIDSFNTWMHKTVYNSCLAVLKKKKATGYLIDEEGKDLFVEGEKGNFVESRTELNPHQETEKREKEVLLKEKIENLPEKYQLPLMLFYYEGLSYKEIADVLGVNIQSVSNWIHRAKSKLKESIANDTRTANLAKPAVAGGATVAASAAADDAFGVFTDESVSEAVVKVSEQASALMGDTAIERALENLKTIIAAETASGSIPAAACAAGAAGATAIAAGVVSGEISDTVNRVVGQAGVRKGIQDSNLLSTVLISAGVVAVVVGAGLLGFNMFNEAGANSESVIAEAAGSGPGSADSTVVIDNEVQASISVGEPEGETAIENSVTYTVTGNPEKADPEKSDTIIFEGESNAAVTAVVTTAGDDSSGFLQKMGDEIPIGLLIAGLMLALAGAILARVNIFFWR